MLTATVQDKMLDAKANVEANNTDPDNDDPIRSLLTEFANGRCEMDAQGDVWNHTTSTWWSDQTAKDFLQWLERRR